MTERPGGDGGPEELRGLDWFEEVYASAAGDGDKVPWADHAPNPWLVDWLDSQDLAGEGRRALVVGHGLGDDAEEMARRGFAVSAFDISPSALAWTTKRFPDSPVDYRLANLFEAPPEWREAFDVVIEIFTVHALDASMRPDAMRAIAGFVKPCGTLFFLCRGREEGPPPQPDRPPHPLRRSELAPFAAAGLSERSFESLDDLDHARYVHRFRVIYEKAPA